MKTPQEGRAAASIGDGCQFGAPDGQASFGIRMRHAQRYWYLSWLLDPEHAMLNPDPVAAMRFGSPAAAEWLIEITPVLRGAARSGDAVVLPIFRQYGGVRLLDCRDEGRCSGCSDRGR